MVVIVFSDIELENGRLKVEKAFVNPSLEFFIKDDYLCFYPIPDDTYTQKPERESITTCQLWTRIFDGSQRYYY